MRQLGYSAWIRQTVSNTVRGKRKLVAEELLGISVAVEVSIVTLLLPSADDPGAVTLPGGQAIRIEQWTPTPAEHPRTWQVQWTRNTPKLRTLEPGGWQ